MTDYNDPDFIARLGSESHVDFEQDSDAGSEELSADVEYPQIVTTADPVSDSVSRNKRKMAVNTPDVFPPRPNASSSIASHTLTRPLNTLPCPNYPKEASH